MPRIDIAPTDATYICCDDPAADYSRACALVAATTWPRGRTSVILLKFPRPCIAPGTGIERAELKLHPWQNRGAEIHPAFSVYNLEADFTGSLATWERQPKFGNFPQASQPASVCQEDGAIHCDITCMATEWLRSGKGQWGIALVAEAGTCLMLHSGYSDHPPCLRLLCCENSIPATPPDGSCSGDYAPEHNRSCFDIAPCGYQEKVFTLHVCNEPAYSPAVDIAQARTVTFLIKNNSCSTMEAALQISPNGRDWLEDKQRVTVPADGLAAITPYLFARYVRLGATLPVYGITANARVWYQAQMFDCTTVG